MSPRSQHVPYSEFRQAVRAYAPTHLLPHLAATAAKMQGPPWEGERFRLAPPWAIAAAARESILWGNEQRSKQLDERGLRNLFWKLGNAVQPPEDGSVGRLLTGILHEQYWWQESPWEELSRVEALLGDHNDALPPIPWADVLGVELSAAIRAAMLLHAGTKLGGGRFTMEWLDDNPQLYSQFAPRDEVATIFRYLTRTIPGHRAVAERAGVLTLSAGRYAFNPLRTAPFVDLGIHGVWAPQHAMIPAAISVPNLWYAGVAAWGKEFADKMGARVEEYAGKNLRSAIGATVLPEIEYGTKQKPAKTIDWFLITDAVVVLVECKSARLHAGAIAGDNTLASLTEQYLAKARHQLDTTAQLIRQRHPALSRIPNDRPLVGLIVTAEPFYLANSGLAEYGAPADIPSMVGSLRDLEQIVRLPAADIGARLLTMATDPTTQFGGIYEQLGDLSHLPENSLLEQAWREYAYLHEETTHTPEA